MRSSPPERESARCARAGCSGRRWRATLSEHPIVTSILLICTSIGALLGYILLGEDLSPAQRLLGGAVGGAGCGLLVTAARMIG